MHVSSCPAVRERYLRDWPLGHVLTYIGHMRISSVFLSQIEYAYGMVNLPGSKNAHSAPASATAHATARKKGPDTPPPTKSSSQKVKIAVLESDPLRFIGFRALFDAEPDMELVSASASDIASHADAYPI